ncbi:hypothetical protein AKJ36_00870 [candidate division MSBL1 archaeon SCGC-AAA259I07]|uniref:Branched-chain amino acid ABC transporter permease n=1 Tax=candidate division MSBL1 archaeon SCGC-AAA259I07 TaxID=1698266 RepID=A0A133UM92_9EURY|nr:hypothetical protein AKJ36_00870 [candidate division MSBL1 archaeon SCGC-AAA259I07]
MLLGFSSALLIGITEGLMYLLVTLGFFMTLKVWNFFNVWHVSVVTLAAYLTYHFYYILHLPLTFSIILSILVVIGIGLLIAKYLYHPLQGSSFTQMILSLGLVFATQATLEMIFGSNPVPYNSPLPAVNFLGVSLTSVLISILSLVLAGSLWYFLRKTRRGRIVYSFSDNPLLAEFRGRNPETIFIYTWTISLILAALAGIFSGWSLTLVPTMGWQLIIIVFSITLLGFTRLEGIVVSSLVIGISMSLGVYFLLPSSYKLAIPLTILIIVYIVRKYR